MQASLHLALLMLLALLAAPAARSAKTGGPAAIAQFGVGVNLALQGDVKAALAAFNQVSAAALDERHRAIRACIRGRFQAGAPVAAPVDVDPWTGAVLSTYRAYWTSVMLHTVALEVANQRLGTRLAHLLQERHPPTTSDDMDALELRLATRLETHGYHALFGITSPMREFMLWRTQLEQAYDVTLPGGTQSVRVEWLDDFVSLGWAGYATCDYFHTGGWAKPDRLYAVRKGYDVDTEGFRVSYLMHEGQHFADYQRFPKLEQPELEYRAKLVELAAAQVSVHQLLDKFGANQSDSRGNPHGWANRRVVGELAAALLHGGAPTVDAWAAVAPSAINAEARRLLQEDSARRVRAS